MAIAGFLVHTLPENTKIIEQALVKIEGLTSYGIHDESYIVAVAESKVNAIESLMENVQKIEGVLAIYLTSLTTEDELTEESTEAQVSAQH